LLASQKIEVFLRLKSRLLIRSRFVKNVKNMGVLLLIGLALVLNGCTQSDTPKNVTERFWKAVQLRDMETAKQLATWDTVSYLKYLQAKKAHPERFELGEVMLSETRAEVATTLYTQKYGKSGVKIPGATVLLKTEQGWRVDVKKTLNSVVKHTIDNVFDQLNGFMQKGLKELDMSLSESMDEVGKALEEGAKELRKELSKPLFSPDDNQPKVIDRPLSKQI